MILIAESKTMSSVQTEVSREELRECRPLFDGTADAIMDALRGRSAEELSAQAGITLRLADTLRRMIYDFPDKSLGMHAIRAFTGVVFRQLQPGAYTEAQNRFLNRNVRIISSLYGWLRPDDIIKPYRLNFKSHVAPMGGTLMKYWKKDVTIALVKELQASGDTHVIDLLPADASKCVDWKLVKRFVTVHKVDFRTVDGAEQTKTPHAGRLKELRGRFLDLIIREGISGPETAATLESDDFMPDPDGAAFPSCLSFITA